MTVNFVDNVILLVVGLIYWNLQSEPFNWRVFWFGCLGGAADSVGRLTAYTAFTKGPGGPITALCCVSTILSAIVESFIHWKSPTYIEILGGVIGFLGAIEFVIPHHMERLFCPCIKRKKEQSETTAGKDIKNGEDELSHLNS